MHLDSPSPAAEFDDLGRQILLVIQQGRHQPDRPTLAPDANTRLDETRRQIHKKMPVLLAVLLVDRQTPDEVGATAGLHLFDPRDDQTLVCSGEELQPQRLVTTIEMGIGCKYYPSARIVICLTCAVA